MYSLYNTNAVGSLPIWSPIHPEGYLAQAICISTPISKDQCVVYCASQHLFFLHLAFTVFLYESQVLSYNLSLQDALLQETILDLITV